MKKTIQTKTPLTGKQQQVGEVQKTLSNDTFFPKGIHIEDIDRTVIQTIKDDFEIVSEGVAVPIKDMFSIQRYTEFMKTWQHSDESHTPLLPFMCLVRAPATKGTNLGGTFNIPNTPTFSLWRRPILKNGRASVEYYQIPQPVNIDCSYTLHIFTYHQRVINKIDELVLHTFKSSQHYIEVNGHSMPLKLEGMEDESQLSDIEKRRYYHKTYNFILKGYLLREKDFKKLSSIDKISITQKASTVKNSRECMVSEIDLDCDFCLNFKFNRKSGNSKTVRVPMDLEFYYDNQNPSNNYAYFVNNLQVHLPFTVKAGDEITVAHGFDYKGTTNIKVCGRKI
jgi:hypothetical protein